MQGMQRRTSNCLFRWRFLCHPVSPTLRVGHRPVPGRPLPALSWNLRVSPARSAYTFGESRPWCATTFQRALPQRSFCLRDSGVVAPSAPASSAGLSHRGQWASRRRKTPTTIKLLELRRISTSPGGLTLSSAIELQFLRVHFEAGVDRIACRVHIGLQIDLDGH